MKGTEDILFLGREDILFHAGMKGVNAKKITKL